MKSDKKNVARNVSDEMSESKKNKLKSKENKTTFKIKDLKDGMKNINIEVEIDFLGRNDNSIGYGEEPYLPLFVKDDTGEIKMLMFGYDLIKKAKPGKKLRITNGYVTEYKGTLQLNYSKENPPKFI